MIQAFSATGGERGTRIAQHYQCSNVEFGKPVLDHL